MEEALEESNCLLLSAFGWVVEDLINQLSVHALSFAVCT